MSQAPTTPERDDATRAATPDQQTEELGQLYRMSKTAGAGSSEYVAVNAVAIFALILGVASLVSVAANILLIVPVLGAVTSLVALRQIGHSYGTQGGKVLAGLGLFLSLAIGSYVVTREATEARRTHSDRQAVAQVLGSLGQTVRDGQFEAAYSLFSPRFHDRVGQAEFTARIRPWSSSPNYGKLRAIGPGSRVEFQVDPQSGTRTARTRLALDVERGSVAEAIEAQLHISEGRWMLDNLPEVFPVQSAAPGGAGVGTGAGGAAGLSG
jgi:hypothetical protein